MVLHSRSWVTGLVGLVILLAISCAGGGSGNPLAPPTGGDGSPPGLTPTAGSDTGLTDPTGQSTEGNQSAGNGAGLWGFYDVAFDESSNQFVIVPVRGAQFIFNVLGFLQPPDGDPTGIEIEDFDASNFPGQGIIELDIRIHHPLPSPKLVGFDTYGVLIGNASIPFSGDPNATFAGPDDLRLLNFDGYTRWMNPVEFTQSGYYGFTEGMLGTTDIDWTASINGYKYFAEGLGANDDLADYLSTEENWALRGAFMPGSSNVRHYEIQFPPKDGGGYKVQFQYAIVARFQGAKDTDGVPIPDPEISDFPAEANAEEAIMVTIDDTSGSNLYYDDDTEQSGGDLILQLTIFDWQGLDAIGGEDAYVLEEIHSIKLDSPDGLFGDTGIQLSALDIQATQINSGETFATLQITLEALLPVQSGSNEIIVAVYNKNPVSYGPNFGAPHPKLAHLASYTRGNVDVIDKEPYENLSPIFHSLEGPTDVDCWYGEALYTLDASDPNDDELTIQWDLMTSGIFPIFDDPPTTDYTYIIDWSDQLSYPPGPYVLWVMMSDEEFDVLEDLEIQVGMGAPNMHPITADDDDTYNVFCTNTDAVYTTSAENCQGDTDFEFRWLRGFGTPPFKPDPSDPDWSEYSFNDSIVYSWDNTQIGNWWVVAEAYEGMGIPSSGDFYIVERVDTPPTDPNPPIGANQVDCNSTAEEYLLSGGNDCDGGVVDRQWALTQTDLPPVAGWLFPAGDVFYIDWSVYPIGTYWLWQRVGSDPNFTISDPLVVTRLNTGPDDPGIPDGPNIVDCSYTDALYQAGVVGDCEDDPADREWALGAEITPPAGGWHSFESTTFNVDFSIYPTGEGYLFQRASDNGGSSWSYSEGFIVLKINAPPTELQIPVGLTGVTCHDTDASYEAGPVDDCDLYDEIIRSWGITDQPFMPPADWIEFTGESFTIDWSQEHSQLWYVYQKATDGKSEVMSEYLAVLKGNAPPDVGPPSGLTDVYCTDTEVLYSETLLFDCDPDTQFFKRYYLSIDPLDQIGGEWIPYMDPSFTIDFSLTPVNDYYLFLSAYDGVDETIGDPLAIARLNTAPDQPLPLDGPAEVDCDTNPEIYDGGEMYDCDIGDPKFRSYYISTDPGTPSGGEWLDILGSMFLIDFDGVIAEQTYFLFQRAYDGSLGSISDSVPVVYHNTPSQVPSPPSGETDVSCVNDNEPYDGHVVNDCDDWQYLTRSWAVNTMDWPPAVSWTEFTGMEWNINWADYPEDTYFLYQRVYDGFDYSYSDSLEVVVGPPILIAPDEPIGATNVICDGPIETYDAGVYIVSCPGVYITREWAVNIVPTPPTTGWTEFTGTTFDVNPIDLGFGNRYIYQRAVLGAQIENSTPIWIIVHPGDLGIPPVPVGNDIITCDSTDEVYDMDQVGVACPGTPITRSWQVRDGLGSPITGWIDFTDPMVDIDWTSYQYEAIYLLLQRADDGEHMTYSNPLVVTYINDEPEFLGSIVGPTDVTCDDHGVMYDGGVVDDCDQNQTLIREWAWNTIDDLPATGWTEMSGTTFTIDYSSSEFEPGDIYLFQRVDDGVVIIDDPVSLHVIYTNTAPEQPSQPDGVTNIDCTNFEQNYFCGDAYDCDNTPLTREWALNDHEAPPVGGWIEFYDDNFDMNWSGAAPDTYYLYQRVSDDTETVISDPLSVEVVNTPPDIEIIECLEGSGPFDTDGETIGLTGLDFVNDLNFSAPVDDCDGDEVDLYWFIGSSPVPPDQGDSSWNGPITGFEFYVDLSDIASEAPGYAFVMVGADDGLNWVTRGWVGIISLHERIYLTTFNDPGSMWTENPCVVGEGSYTWDHDLGLGYLRLEDYGDESTSSVWSAPVTFPTAPDTDEAAVLRSYLNPALASGYDNTVFGFLKEAGCDQTDLDVITGDDCGANDSQLMEFDVDDTLPVWDDTQLVGLTQNGFDGCTSSDFWVDWVGIWIGPV